MCVCVCVCMREREKERRVTQQTYCFHVKERDRAINIYSARQLLQTPTGRPRLCPLSEAFQRRASRDRRHVIPTCILRPGRFGSISTRRSDLAMLPELTAFRMSAYDEQGLNGKRCSRSSPQVEHTRTKIRLPLAKERCRSSTLWKIKNSATSSGQWRKKDKHEHGTEGNQGTS